MPIPVALGAAKAAGAASAAGAAGAGAGVSSAAGASAAGASGASAASAKGLSSLKGLDPSLISNLSSARGMDVKGLLSGLNPFKKKGEVGGGAGLSSIRDKRIKELRKQNAKRFAKEGNPIASLVANPTRGVNPILIAGAVIAAYLVLKPSKKKRR